MPQIGLRASPVIFEIGTFLFIVGAGSYDLAMQMPGGQGKPNKTNADPCYSSHIKSHVCSVILHSVDSRVLFRIRTRSRRSLHSPHHIRRNRLSSTVLPHNRSSKHIRSTKQNGSIVSRMIHLPLCVLELILTSRRVGQNPKSHIIRCSGPGKDLPHQRLKRGRNMEANMNRHR